MKKTCISLTLAFIIAFAAHAEDARTATIIAKAASAWTEKDAEAAISAAAREDPASVELVTGIVRHNLAVTDPGRWAAAAIEALGKSSKNGNPFAMAYHGSALTLRAGLKSGTGDVMGATADLDAGFALLDKAVRAAPDVLTLRFLRAENAASTSEQSPFKRWDVASQDVAVIEKSSRALSAEDRAGLELLKARISFGRGAVEEGLRSLEAAVRAAPSSKTADAARAMLADLEE
jgi:hypothetical protein